MEMGGNVNEWRLLKTVSEVNLANNTLIVNTDNDGQPFSVDELYVRIKNITGVGISYHGFSLKKNVGIGELKSGNKYEVFVKNIGGFWKCFYMPYKQEWENATMNTFAGLSAQYSHTIQEFPKITHIEITFVKDIEAEIYAR